MMSKKMLAAYFSVSGMTAKAARKLAEETGADLYEISQGFLIAEQTLTGQIRKPAVAWR